MDDEGHAGDNEQRSRPENIPHVDKRRRAPDVAEIADEGFSLLVESL